MFAGWNFKYVNLSDFLFMSQLGEEIKPNLTGSQVELKASAAFHMQDKIT